MTTDSGGIACNRDSSHRHPSFGNKSCSTGRTGYRGNGASKYVAQSNMELWPGNHPGDVCGAGDVCIGGDACNGDAPDGVYDTAALDGTCA